MSVAKKFIRSRDGSIAIQVALLMTVLIGFVALGTEITFTMLKHRQMQSAADSAALGGAIALATGYPADYVLESRAIAASTGFVDGVGGVTVTVVYPPTTGHYAGDSGAIEVIVSQPQTLSMVSLFRSGIFNVGASAVAVVGGAGGFCVLQLKSSSITGVSMSNGVTVNLTKCGMAVNATSSSALSVIGGATLNAQSVSVSGGTVVNNGAVINATNGVKTYQAAMADPYAGVAQPSYSGCAYTNKSLGHSNSGRQYISPGVYCNGLAFTNDAIVTMNPGVYIIDRGTFDVGGAVQLTGTGVTIFLTKSTGASYADINIGNGATVVLTAPTTGATAGLVFFGDRNAPVTTTSTFHGGAAMNVTGAMYFPSQTAIFSNGVSNPSGCTQLIAGVIQFTGGAQFQNNCGGTGTVSIGGSDSVLAE